VDQHYEALELAELYDADSPWSVDRDYYLALAGEQPVSILDLGCGTGLLCDAFAMRGHFVTGVDPARAMLDVARRKPNGGNIEWVRSTAEDFRSNRRFDLIVMTGNAFQALLTDVEARGALETMARHLAPGGKAVFETRNPVLDWQSQVNAELTLDHNGQTVIEERRFQRMDGNVMHFDLHYRFPDRTVSTESRIRFWTQPEIEKLATAAGLSVTRVLGDWKGEPLDQSRSKEMVFVMGAA
jgi:SAM-dependent methyltransferase